MIQQVKQENWNKVRKQIQTKFDKLSKSEIDGLNGKMENLSSTVQKVYGYNQKKADKECNSFIENLSKD